MKIVLAVRTYPTRRGGGMPFVTQDRAHELVRQGHEVHILTTGMDQGGMVIEEPVDAWFQDGTEWRKGPTGSAVTVHHLPCAPETYSTTYAQQCDDLVRRLQPEIVHLDGFDRDNPWYSGGTWRKAITLHGFGWGGTLSNWQAYRTGRGDKPIANFEGMKKESIELRDRFHAVITISTQEYWLAEDLYGLTNVHLVYNPILPDYFIRPLVPPPAEKQFLCASITGQAMRCWDFAQACCAEAGVKLVQVKDVPRDQMPALYDQSTAVLVLSLYEQGFDLTCAEAAARGRAIICHNIGSYGREAEGDKFMVTIPPLDRAALIELLQAPVENYPLIANLQQSIHQPSTHVAEWFQAIGI